MIGEKFSENHPVMMGYNSNLIEVYSQTGKEEKTRSVIPICEKNLEISKNSYGEKSIYSLKYNLAIASNYIANMKIQQGNSYIVKMKDIIVAFHDNNAYDLSNQYFYLG
jgi:hypothetical protein